MERAWVALDNRPMTPAEFVAWRSSQLATGGQPPAAGQSWASCPDCIAPVTPRAVGQLPVGDHPYRAQQPAPHFAHLPGTGDPACAYLSPTDARDRALTSGLRAPDEVVHPRRLFVTDDQRLTHAGYLAGLVMLELLGRHSPRDPHFFAETPTTLLSSGLLPPPGHSSWRRHMPGWARPYVWLQYHAFQLEGRRGTYGVALSIAVPAGSYLRRNGVWLGPPATLRKHFADTGRVLTNRRGEVWQASITREAARAAARAALARAPRPYPHVPVHKLQEHWLFGAEV